MLHRILSSIDRKLRYRHKSDSRSFIKFLRKRGVSVGEDTVFFSPHTNIIDVTRPYLLKIGNSCKITAGVVILTHDYSYSVLRIAKGYVLNECGETVIGDNVFIGINSIILPNVRIGNNTVIGSGSVVTNDLPDGVVAAGNPCKIICSLDEFLNKRLDALEQGAIRNVRAFRARYGRNPRPRDLGSFFPLYFPSNEALLRKSNIKLDWSGDSEEAVIQSFLNHPELQVYGSFSDFLDSVEGEES